MSVRVLERLKSEEFALAVGFLATPGPLRRFLRKTEQVAAIRAALEQGALTDETLRAFVSNLMRDFRHGERFRHELALGTLAVALEMRPTEFAAEFLHELSRLQVAEMGLCVRIARKCLQHRVSLTQDKGKVFDLGTLDQQTAFSVQALPRTYGQDPLRVSQVSSGV